MIYQSYTDRFKISCILLYVIYWLPISYQYTGSVTQDTTYPVQRTLYNVPCTTYPVQRTLYNVPCTTYPIRCTVYNVYGVQCTP